jgi:beta-galactosidase
MPWKAPPASLPPGPAPKLEEDSGFVRASGPGFSVAVGKKSGALETYRIDGVEMLAKPLVPNFWKVPNDNEYRNRYLERTGAWRKAGPDRKVESVTAQMRDAAVEVAARMRLPVGDSEYVVTYSIRGNGSVEVRAEYKPGAGELPLIPRFGMQAALPARHDRIEWYGRGPHETYWDRQTGGEIGIWKLGIEEFIHPYIRAQDNANRTDVRWVCFTDEKGVGIRATGLQPLSVSAWPYTMEDLEKATHDYQLPRREFITVNIDWKLEGVGGDNSWGARTHPQYTLPGNKPYSYGFVLETCRAK